MSTAKNSGRKPHNIRSHNKRLILSLIRHEGEVTARQISNLTGLSFTTITRILPEMQALGIIISVGKGESSSEGGKKPEIYTVSSDYCYSFGCYINEKFILTSLLDFSYRSIASRTIEQDDGATLDKSVRTASEMMHSIAAERGISINCICGIAVCLDGVINSSEGTLIRPVRQSYWGENIDVAAMFKKYNNDVPNIYLLNSSHAIAYASYINNSDLYKQQVYHIHLDDLGVGGCFVNNGKIVYGADNLLGEIGHMIIRPDYRAVRCSCGRYGCFESLVTKEALLRQITDDSSADPILREEAISLTLSTSELFCLADKGNHSAQRVIRNLSENLIILIRNLMLVNNPEVIVIGGKYVEYGCHYFLSCIEEMIQSDYYLSSSAKNRIQFDKMDVDMAGPIGCGCYALDTYMESLLAKSD